MLLLYYCYLQSYSKEIDERLIVQRPGYGVTFSRLHELADGGGSITYSHTWLINIPKYRLPIFPDGSICGISMDGFEELCNTIDSMIMNTEINIKEKLNMANVRMKYALKVIPETPMSTLLEPPKKKIRRNAPTLPSFTDKPFYEDFLDMMPSRIIGNFASDLFNMPGSKAVDNIKSKIRSVAGAMHTNMQSIVSLGNSLSSIISVVEKRMQVVQEMGTKNVADLNTVRENINSFYNATQIQLGKFADEISRLNRLKSVFISRVIPLLMTLERRGDDMVSLTHEFTQGVLALMYGKITAALVPENMMKSVIDHVAQNVLTLPQWRDYGLISTSPAYFYRFEDIAFTRTENHLILTMNFPLVLSGSRMPLYRIDVFPVPTAAGIRSQVDTGHTLIQDLPGFIAVSENTENFIEITIAQFLACKGQEIKTCGESVGIISNKESMTCAFAIFIDNHIAVRRLCDISYTKEEIRGSALQIAANGRFIVHGGSEMDNWILSCPDSSRSPITHVQPCSYCQVEIPCGCSLTANHFLVPRRISDCDVIGDEVPKMTTFYTRNTAMVTSMLSEEDSRSLRSYELLLDTMYPPFHVPAIKFTSDAQFHNWIEKSDKYKSNYTKVVELVKRDMEIFQDKTDAALRAARNFSDQTLYRAPNMAKAFGELFSIFGDFGTFLMALSSPVILGLIGTAIMSFSFLPRCMPDIVIWYKSRREIRQANQQTKKCMAINTRGHIELENYYYDDDDDGGGGTDGDDIERQYLLP